MNIVLFGQKWLAMNVLKGLLVMSGVSVRAVCPDRNDERLTMAAIETGIRLIGIDEVPECDLGVAAHCQRYMPATVREKCGLGVLSYHPSLLPRHRGRDAVYWTVTMRGPIAGGTTYWMDNSADTGSIESQDWCHVLPNDTATTLWRRELAPMGLRLLLDDVLRLSKGGTPRWCPQNPAVATWEPALNSKPLSMGKS